MRRQKAAALAASRSGGRQWAAVIGERQDGKALSSNRTVSKHDLSQRVILCRALSASAPVTVTPGLSHIH